MHSISEILGINITTLGNVLAVEICDNLKKERDTKHSDNGAISIIVAYRGMCSVVCRVYLYLAVSAPGAADTGRRPTGPSASGGDRGEGPHLRAYSCSAAAGPPPPNSSESRRVPAPPATAHTLPTPATCSQHAHAEIHTSTSLRTRYLQ